MVRKTGALFGCLKPAAAGNQRPEQADAALRQSAQGKDIRPAARREVWGSDHPGIWPGEGALRKQDQDLFSGDALLDHGEQPLSRRGRLSTAGRT